MFMFINHLLKSSYKNIAVIIINSQYKDNESIETYYTQRIMRLADDKNTA